MVRVLADDADEFLRFCGVVGLGRLLAEASCASRSGGAAPEPPRGAAGTEPEGSPHPAAVARELTAMLRGRATDASWRVREAVAMALQRVGDSAPAVLRSLATEWAADPHPLVQRAAVAGICEPRLLGDETTAAAALDACATATDRLARRPTSERRGADVRVLRQGLGYCWSVAVAAAPIPGLPRFLGLTDAYPGDSDVAWIARENAKKKRLSALLVAT
ncbi:HEAT repeat domain-containing protein [Xylanimonas allomyrinae]|nr:HEAT repeat domain-containing protein [Xylanimonas allomyrinae]